jgi:hypothetical protein
VIPSTDMKLRLGPVYVVMVVVLEGAPAFARDQHFSTAPGRRTSVSRSSMDPGRMKERYPKLFAKHGAADRKAHRAPLRPVEDS